MHKEKTLVLIKPDGVERGLIGKIIERFENRGIKIVAMKMLQPDKKRAEKHYREDIAERYGEKVRNNLIKYLCSGPVVAMVLEGVEVVKVVRSMCGATYPSESSPGTIRGDFSHISKDYANNHNVMIKNVIHASSSQEEAKIEIDVWFNKNEILEYKRVDEVHIWG